PLCISRTASPHFYLIKRPPPRSPPFPYTPLFRSSSQSAATSPPIARRADSGSGAAAARGSRSAAARSRSPDSKWIWAARRRRLRSEEHTSELQSRENLVCRLLLEKKNIT